MFAWKSIFIDFFIKKKSIVGLLLSKLSVEIDTKKWYQREWYQTEFPTMENLYQIKENWYLNY